MNYILLVLHVYITLDWFVWCPICISWLCPKKICYNRYSNL